MNGIVSFHTHFSYAIRNRFYKKKVSGGKEGERDVAAYKTDIKSFPTAPVKARLGNV